MSRGWAMLIAAVAGGIAALVATTFAGLFLFGSLWMFVLGDDPWPAWVEPAFDLALPVVAALLWAIFAR
ncbi:MAG TPA: hypothetical protein VFK58_07165, partial [Sphingomicrobium sp.]|nr:hypothetical protein [Sphingomicrobium sp.]